MSALSNIRNLKDPIYDVLSAPTRENFREFLKKGSGEYSDIDFKETWIEKEKLAKIILAMANSGGGIVVIGMKESEDGSCEPIGIDELSDKAKIDDSVKGFIPRNLSYEVHDFSYDNAEYEKLKGKKFQILQVFDQGAHLPYISQKAGKDIEKDIIYIRRASKCEKANSAEIEAIITRRVNDSPISSKMPLDEQLKQLKILFGEIEPKLTTYPKNPFEKYPSIASMMIAVWGKPSVVDNPFYPAENYESFIRRMIDAKKIKIEKELGLR